MKKITFSLMIIMIIAIYSCIKPKGIWPDNIHLSTKTAEFSAYGDSVTIKTEGISWWVDAIFIDDKWYGDYNGIDQIHTETYSIKQDFVDVERRDKNTLFIKVEANRNSVDRIIIVGLEAGDYHDAVTITQKSN